MAFRTTLPPTTLRFVFLGLVFGLFTSVASASVKIDISSLSGQVPMTIKDQEILFKAAAKVEQRLHPSPILYLNTNSSAQDAARDLEQIDELIIKPNESETWGCGRVECGGERF